MLDRLARSLEHLIELSAKLQERGFDMVVLDQSIDTSTAMGRMSFPPWGRVPKHGAYTGRKPALTAEQAPQLRERARRRAEICARPEVLGISRETVYSYRPVRTNCRKSGGKP